jgi:putative DNA primase/helicase
MTDKAAAGTAAIEVAAIKVGLWAKATQVRFGINGARLLYRKSGIVRLFDLAICDRPFGDTLDVWVAPPKLAAFAEAAACRSCKCSCSRAAQSPIACRDNPNSKLSTGEGTAMTTIDLSTGIERPSDPKDYITKISAVRAAKPGTPHPLWNSFLARVTNNDAELVEFLKRFLGYCCTGDTFEHVLMFLYGTGANGKGVFINTITSIMNDYAVIAPMELFMASKNERHPTEIAKLRGARLVVAQETEKGRRWDETKIKMLTSSDKLTGRFMRQDFFDFKPTHKLIITGNHKPSLRSIDEAIRRRFLLVPFTVTIPPAERDPQLAEKLKPEWPAILRWMFDGSYAWHHDGGLKVPATVRNATDDYLADQDTMGLWIADWIIRDVNAFTPTATLFTCWKVWCERTNNYAGTERAFSEDLVEHGFERDRKNYGRGFNGIALRANDGPRSSDEDE